MVTSHLAFASTWAAPLSGPLLASSTTDFWSSTSDAWHIAGGVLATVAAIVLIRLNMISIWRNNAEGYKEELALQADAHKKELEAAEERHRKDVAELKEQVDQLFNRIADQDKEIQRLSARTDLTPLLDLIPLVHDIHESIKPKSTTEEESWH